MDTPALPSFGCNKRFDFLVSSSFTVRNFVECGVAFSIFAKQCAFDQGKRYWLTVHFRIDGAHAGRAIECSQRSEYQSQRL